MRTTTLGTHGPRVGVIGLGAMGMSSAYDMATPRDEATSVSLIHQALHLGVTLLDTADVYGPYTNEELLGRALAGRRDRAVHRLAPRPGAHLVPIPGTKTPKYLTDNAAAADVQLSPADIADLDAIPAPVGVRY